MIFNKHSQSTNNYHLDADEVMFESSVIQGSEQGDYQQYEHRLKGIGSYLPLLVVIGLALLFTGRIYFLQHEDQRGLVDQANRNLFQVSEVIADRGEIFDRHNVPLVWNTRGQDDEFATRNYINVPGFAHVLGFISLPLKDNDNNFSRAEYIARAGVERAYNDILGGKNGKVISETDAIMSTTSGERLTPATNGQDLILSIDTEVQSVLFNSIKSLADKVGFARGSGAIMDITTGELIALTNYPEYSRDFNATQANQQFINLFTEGLFTPGSIVKPFMALAALNEGIVSPDKSILSTKTIIIPNRYNPDQPTYFSDWKAHGYVNVRQALAVSSNAYFYAVGGGLYDQEGIGINSINKYMTAFGLGEAASIDRFKEVTGVIPSVEWKKETYPEDPTWRLGDTFLTSIGQYGWQVTPLQMLRGVAAIANRGTLVQPTLWLGDEVRTKPVPVEITDSAYQIVHEGMRMSATEGTARGLNVDYLAVAAKTGTAELGVSKANVNSWVTGFWPYDNPRYAFVVILNEGSRYNLTGATFAMRETFDVLRQKSNQYVDDVFLSGNQQTTNNF